MPKDQISAPEESLADTFQRVRERSLAWTEPLSAEDLCVQTIADVSPGKWHLAHTTWFWEAFLLAPFAPAYEPFDARFNYLFNSYYEAIGERHPRPRRGELTRPSLDEIRAYRAHVDAAVLNWLETAEPAAVERAAAVMRTGFAHEEQHQELFLTDIKHVLSCNSFPEAAYGEGGLQRRVSAAPRPPAPEWATFDEGLHEFGYAGDGFAFDNEGPVHKAWIAPFALATAPVTNAEFLAFIEDGGYRRPELWLSDGWAAIQAENRRAPFYWRESEQGWVEHTLHGEEPLDPAAPACHLDYYEASAFAEWTGYRLPEEREWELAARSLDPAAGRWAEPGGRLHPVEPPAGEGLRGVFGEVWEWTRSAYAPYPGYRAPAGAIGEYNGKFMCGQFVLRGGSALTPPGHARATYRNFFPPDARWQMTGLRLARDV